MCIKLRIKRFYAILSPTLNEEEIATMKTVCEKITKNDDTYFDIFQNRLDEYQNFLSKNERSEKTISTYRCVLNKFKEYVISSGGTKNLSRELLNEYKKHLENNYKTSSANTYIIVLNTYFKHLQLDDCYLPMIITQKTAGVDNVIDIGEYEDLKEHLKNISNYTTYLIIKTLACTGIRVSELQYVTVESLSECILNVKNKNKIREVLIPDQVASELMSYCKENEISTGAIFRAKNSTKKGLHPSSIWRRIQTAASQAGISKEKAHPHSFRHLFAKVYLSKTNDLVSLADILGHENINTTRIYTRESRVEKREKLNSLGL